MRRLVSQRGEWFGLPILPCPQGSLVWLVGVAAWCKRLGAGGGGNSPPSLPLGGPHSTSAEGR